MTEHLSRKQALSAAQGQLEGASRRHLRNCPECNDLTGLLASFEVAGHPMLTSAPQNWVSKAMAIGETVRTTGLVKTAIAALSFDSWSRNLVLGVRGTVQDERRLRFEHETVMLDLRAEHLGSSWRFVARVSAEDSAPVDLALEIDGERLYPDQSGFVDWSALQPPSFVIVATPTYTVTTPPITWTYGK